VNSLATGPDFLCIGARKTGTTWLYKFLQAHPDCAMPAMKEINFFNSPLFSCNGIRRPRLERKWAETRKKLGLSPDSPMPSSWAEAPERWYFGLFARQAGVVSGDVSPLYQEIHDDRISRVHRLLPKTKIIYILRHPLERILSDFSMYANNRRIDVPSMDHNELFELFRRQYARSMGYAEIYARWAEHFPVAVFFYEELKSNPEGFADSICDYLNIRRAPALAATSKNPNPSRTFGPRPNIPSSVTKRLAQELLPELEALTAIRDNALTRTWLKDVESEAKRAA
jgi:hypothetical protein